ncbi:MAG: HEAT repeat domain-containing protein [Anaerolineales bacterium]|nr:HEAT repeat domain-containing protein [Anaerolineales bacterium]
MIHRRFLLFCLIPVCLAGCALLDQSTPAPTPTPFPEPEPLSLVVLNQQVVDTVCLEIRQAFPNAPGRGSFPLEESISGVLEAAGMQVVEDDCTAMLAYDLQFEALAANYVPGGQCYTGLEVTGEMSLTVDSESYTSRLFALREPADTVGTCIKDPADSFNQIYPIHENLLMNSLREAWGDRILLYGFNSDFYSETGNILQDLGMDVLPLLLEGMRHPSAEIRKGSITTLDYLDPPPIEALPALIAALDDPHEGGNFYRNSSDGSFFPNLDVQRAAIDTLRRCYGPLAEPALPKLVEILKVEIERENKPAVNDIVSTLETISGEQLGEDWEAWQEWLETQG